LVLFFKTVYLNEIKIKIMKKSLPFVIISSLFWIFVILLCKTIQSGESQRVFYYHGEVRHLCTHNHYTSQEVLFSDLFKSGATNSIFKWCCDCIQFYGHSLGYSYEEFNLVIFVIIQPALIVFLFSWIVFLVIKNRAK
jgi:hypothetical protein